MTLELLSQQGKLSLIRAGMLSLPALLSPCPRCLSFGTSAYSDAPTFASVTLAAEAYASIYPC